MVTTRRAWPVLAAAVLLLGSVSVILGGRGPRAGAARAPAQTPPDTEPLSASLLRRLAAAADGYRTGERVYVVAAFDPPHNVAGVFANPDEAVLVRDSVQRKSHQRYGKFGPYRSPKDQGRPIVFLARPRCWPTIFPCWLARWRPSEGGPVFVKDLDSVSIVAYRHSGPPWRMTADPMELDAVFFTMSAIDKFVLPYYTALSGPAYAAMLRDSLEAYIRTAPER
ncbi:MAG: hypothetical protein ACREMF_08030 [Gemmatimonadales bacterium]